MAGVSRSNWIKLYKNLQRAACEYNYRHFAKRRIRDYFEKYRGLKDEVQLNTLYKEGIASVTTIQRQASISKLYPNRKLVIEQDKPSSVGQPKIQLERGVN
uniref:Complex 1 LYR protein domain-containing protein n=1 Tax=Ditylenchus dipsaci TaxID=166011 RepID=A0A915EEA2_9BILA